MRMQAAPERLDTFADAANQMVDDLDLAATHLGHALDDLRSSRGRAEFLDDVPPLDAHLRQDADRLALLGHMTAAIAARLRRVDDTVDVVAPGFDPLLLSGLAWDVMRFRGPALPPDFDAAFWLATPAGQEALATARDLLTPGFWGIGNADLARLRRLFQELPAPVADAVVVGLTDDELARLVRAMDGSWLPGFGWASIDRHEFWTIICSRVSLDSVRRLAHFTDDLDPPPATALDDAAADRADRRDWFDALVYRPFDGWLTWQGDGQPHAIHLDDTTQGRIGNCYLLAAMMAIAERQPALLEEMIASNPNGTFTVTFADGMRVTVSPDVPVHPDDPTRPAFAGRALAAEHRDAPGERLELWPLVLEKAHAQRHGGWGEIVGGHPGVTVEELVGGTRERLDPAAVEADDLRNHLDAGAVLTLATLSSERAGEEGQAVYEDDRLLTGLHAYVIRGVDPDGHIELHNPWEARHVRPLLVTIDQLRAIGMYIDVNELP